MIKKNSGPKSAAPDHNPADALRSVHCPDGTFNVAIAEEAARIKAELMGEWPAASPPVRAQTRFETDDAIRKNSGPKLCGRTDDMRAETTTPAIAWETLRAAEPVADDGGDDDGLSDLEESGYIVIDKETGHVWAHPLIAVECPRWLSPEFDELAKDPRFLQTMLDEYLDGAPRRPESFADALMAKMLELAPTDENETLNS